MESISPTETWLREAIDEPNSFIAQVVGRFTDQLVRQAESRLPRYLRARIDPEDVVQSVYRSFIRKHQQNEFQFSTSNDVWRLLSAMTYHKVLDKTRHHHRDKRNVGRDRSLDAASMDAISQQVASGSAITIMFEVLRGILEKLPPTHQQIVVMRMSGYSIEEIAQREQISTRTVDRTLKRVRMICGKDHSGGL